MDKKIEPIKKYDKTIECEPDKSITHRAIMFNAFGFGKCKVYNALKSQDTLATMDCMRKLGSKIDDNGNYIEIKGLPLKEADLYVGNSGTAIRLLSGLLCGVVGKFTITGDESVCSRPMNRVIQPLSMMGATIASSDGRAPLTIIGQPLNGIEYEMPIASAQVKSAILLAGLNAAGSTAVIERIPSRDHTERMLKIMGADIKTEATKTVITSNEALSCTDIFVAGDISSAAYPLCLAAAVKGGHVRVNNVGVNPTRTGLLDVLKDMGADIVLKNERMESGEPIADIELNYAPLKPFCITENIVPRLIDELPVLAVLACFADGVSTISGAGELRVKECDRIEAMAKNLTALGANIEVKPDGMIITGGKLKSGTVESFNDHRIAMAMSVAGRAGAGVTIKGAEWAAVSYADFYSKVL